MHGGSAARARQRGWAAVITLLVALLIVAVLAGTILKQQGPAAGAARVDADVDASKPMERARALEQSVHEQAADRDKRIDDAAK